ncbi:MAG TPA: DUF4127 family protein [Bacillales bacterium]|nr:DUF4127 family protein [Bacillales bacterium]
MRRRIALVPVDARPVTCDLAGQITRIAGWEVLTPPKEILGFLRNPGDIDGVHQWLVETADHVEGFVLSMDMIHYGGLVPSRITRDSREAVSKRTKLLSLLKDKYPSKPILAFSSTMRISDSYVNEEEKLYWSDYGRDLFTYSFHSHRFEKTKSSEAEAKMLASYNQVPTDILKDYLQTRERNAMINLSLIEYVESGIVDTLVFPQDDTAEYGMNIREQERLHEEILQRRLFDQVYIYPGADEVACVLVAKLVFQLEGINAPTFYPFFSGETGAFQNALYEDRPLIESVKGQVYALGGFIEDVQNADIRLAVNVPGRRQGEIALRNHLSEVDTPDRNIGEWLRKLHHFLKDGKPVAIVDLAYANGADPAMIIPLLSKIDISCLSGFAAWNTAGNSIGTVVAQAAMVHLRQLRYDDLGNVPTKELTEQLILRFLDDFVYQSIVRSKVREQYDETTLSKEQLLKVVKENFLPEAEVFFQEKGMKNTLSQWDIQIENVFLPWERTFEIGMDLSLKPKYGL